MALQDASSVNTFGNDHNLPQVLVHTEKGHLPPPDGGETQHYLPDGLIVGSPPFNTQNLHTTQPASDTSSSSTFWKRKRLWLPLATLVFLAAIIGGIVGGLLIHRDPPSRQATNESPSPRANSASITPSPNSDLAATWTQHGGSACESCGEQTILLAYEDSNNKLSVVNVTSSGPRWTTLDADPRPGTGLAVNLQWRNNAPRGVRLYYQRNKDDLVSIDWEPQSGLRDTGISFIVQTSRDRTIQLNSF
ncbi:MAG: hypothetical protein Q9221_000984 [Calogaya cf. arnoldii]